VLVLTTCHATNFALVKSWGADAVLDYHDPDCPRKIREYLYTGTHESRLRYVLDCVSTRESYGVIEEALPEPNFHDDNNTDTDTDPEAAVKFVTLLPPPLDTDTSPRLRSDLTPIPIPSSTTFDKASSSKFIEFWALSRGLLEKGLVRAHPVAVRGGGLGGITKG
jgi:hypothetical protein